MSFDPRSLDRLRELGRTLPKPLPAPELPAAEGSSASTPGAKRHRVETETDPDALFHELMRVSSDGTVPPHLMDRLRDAEATRRRQRQTERLTSADPAFPAAPSPPAGTASPPSSQRRGSAPPLPGTSPSRGRQGRKKRARGASAGAGAPEQELYTAFQQLLLEEDDPA